jgi:hypothetical protein
MVIRKIPESHWFAPVFALVQTLRHIGMLAYVYWSASQFEKNFNAWEFIRRDLARPLFEPFGFCDAWTHFGFAQSALFGLDLPIYAIATIVQSAMTAQACCVEALTTPRGRIVTATLALPVWFLAGLGLRRLGLRQWRRPASSKALRSLLYLILPSGVLGGLLLALAATTPLVSNLGTSVRLIGLGLWFVWLGMLSAERLRVWPFAKLLLPEPSR